MTKKTELQRIKVAAWAAFAIMVITISSKAFAQETGYSENMSMAVQETDDPVVTMSRMCVAEIGFIGTVEECILMWQINMENVIRYPGSPQKMLIKQIKRFNSYFTHPKRRLQRPWIAELLDDTKPESWPINARWSYCKRKWLKYLEAARQFLNSTYMGVTMCPGAIDYGSQRDVPGDVENKEVIKCLDGETLQRYWRRK